MTQAAPHAEQLDLFDVATTPMGRAATDATEHLPEVAKVIHGLVGPESMIRFIRKWGGTHIDFPKCADRFDTSEIVRRVADEIGIADAKLIATHYAGVRLWVPICKKALLAVRNRKIKADLDACIPARVIAQKWQMHERNVWFIAKSPD
jgi:hypothetical protein